MAILSLDKLAKADGWPEPCDVTLGVVPNCNLSAAVAVGGGGTGGLMHCFGAQCHSFLPAMQQTLQVFGKEVEDTTFFLPSVWLRKLTLSTVHHCGEKKFWRECNFISTMRLFAMVILVKRDIVRRQNPYEGLNI